MFNKRKISLLIICICLIAVCLVFAGCEPMHQHKFDSDWRFDDTYHWKKCSCGKTGAAQKHEFTSWIVDKAPTSTAEGSRHSTCDVCGKVINQTIPKNDGETSRTVDFYAINDFHGEVDKISQFCGYLSQVSNGNTMLLNSGDMFQGSMESNSNYGKLLADCMAATGFDEMTLGNHEFDWGLDNLSKLSGESGVPFLGANIYNWNATDKTWGDFASDLAQEYIVKTLDNGLKVGVIGVIGENQITSISSNLVQTIGFKDPMPIIKTLSAKLRNELDCDVVVVSAHASPCGLVGESDDAGVPASSHDLYKYVDAVFCAHTHQEQLFTVDGLPFIQGGSNGAFVSRVQLTVSEDGTVYCSEKQNIPYSLSWPNKADVGFMVDNSNDKIKDEANRVLTTVSGGYLGKSSAVPRLVSRAIAEYAVSQGYDITLAMANSARNSLSGEVTYSNLYNAIPFDNVVYVANVLGSEILNEARYGVSFWRVDGTKIESNKYYKIAVLDYLLYHQNARRDYNYFPSAFYKSNPFKPVALTKAGVDVYNYRLITRDWLLSAGGYVSSYDYVYANDNTDPDMLTSNVYLSEAANESAVSNNVILCSYYDIEKFFLKEEETVARAIQQ